MLLLFENWSKQINSPHSVLGIPYTIQKHSWASLILMPGSVRFNFALKYHCLALYWYRWAPSDLQNIWLQWFFQLFMENHSIHDLWMTDISIVKKLVSLLYWKIRFIDFHPFPDKKKKAFLFLLPLIRLIFLDGALFCRTADYYFSVWMIDKVQICWSSENERHSTATIWLTHKHLNFFLWNIEIESIVDLTFEWMALSIGRVQLSSVSILDSMFSIRAFYETNVISFRVWKQI